MKSTVIIYTALVLVGTATGISIQQPNVQNQDAVTHKEKMHLETTNRIKEAMLKSSGDRGGQYSPGSCCYEGYCQYYDANGWNDGESECALGDGVWFEGLTCCEIECESYGACCIPTGSCIDGLATWIECTDVGGSMYMGDTCATLECESYEFDVACCLPNGDCLESIDAYNCWKLDGKMNPYVEGGPIEPGCANNFCEYIFTECEEINAFSNVAVELNAEGCINNIFIGESVGDAEPWFTTSGGRIQINDNTYSVATYPTIYPNNATAPQNWYHHISLSPLAKQVMVTGYKKSGVISGMSICDISQIDYSNIVPDDGWLDCSLSSVGAIGLHDVTQDGKLDLILQITRLVYPCGTGSPVLYGCDGTGASPDYNGTYYCYVENILESSGVACASDLNGDGAVEVNDLMQVVSDWGACP